VTFEDVPGCGTGTAAEMVEIHQARREMLYAFAGGDRSQVTVVTRKGYGRGYCVIGIETYSHDGNYAWQAEIAVMGQAGAVDMLQT